MPLIPLGEKVVLSSMATASKRDPPRKVRMDRDEMWVCSKRSMIGKTLDCFFFSCFSQPLSYIFVNE